MRSRSSRAAPGRMNDEGDARMMGRLRRKFAAVAMAAVTVVLLSMVACINVVNYMNLCERADERLEVLSEGGGAFPDEGVAAAASALAERAATRRAARPPAYTPEAPFETRYFTVTLSAEGDVLDSNTGKIAAVGAETAVAIARDVCARGGASGFYDVYRYRADDLADGSKMYIFLDCTRELDSFHSFLAVSAGVSALGWTLVFLLVVGFSRLAVRPIVEGYEKQKRFITDASHEIKTPLAVIRAANEVIALEHGEDEWTRSIDEQAERLGALTERLVLLARMDEGASALSMGDVSLSGVVEDVVTLYRPVAESRGKAISASIDAGLNVQGDKVALTQALELLVDNATRYASSGTVIEVSARRRGRACEVVVKNECDAVPKGDLDRLFERFYRDDVSRSARTGGSGVGLSVVRAIAEAHGGTVRAESTGPRSIAFILRI